MSALITRARCLFATKKTRIIAFCIVTAGVVGFANDLFGLWDMIGPKPQEKLAVIQARLQPFRTSPLVTHSVNDLFLMMEVRNYGEKTMMLTSAEIDIKKSRVASKGKAGSFSRCALTDDANRNTPILLRPGETSWIMVSQAVTLPGLTDWLNNDELKNIFVATPENAFTIAQHDYLPVFNKKMAEHYGADAEIEAVVHFGQDGGSQVFHFPLANGKDIYDKSGGLQHDWFIANWLYPQPSRLRAEGDICHFRSG